MGAAMFAASAGAQFGAGIANAYNSNVMGKIQARQYNLQAEEMELQKRVIADQYQTKRQQLHGSAVARAANSGVKVSGSVADSISQSLTELGMEENYQKYSITAKQNRLNYQAKIAKLEGRSQMIAGFLNTTSTALSNYATYDYYWGSGGSNGGTKTTTQTKTPPVPQRKPF